MKQLSIIYCHLILQVFTTGTSSQRETTEQTCHVSSCPDILLNDVTMMSCTNGFKIESKCTFTCPQYHGRVGEPSIRCRQTSHKCGKGEWSSRIPYCRALFCSEPPDVGMATFTCSRNLKLGSVCKYKCNDGYRLIPPGHSGFLCYKNATWVGDPKPCCIVDVGPCPPNLKADIAFYAESSRSIGKQNFKLIKSFVQETIRRFQLGKDRARFAFIRYNQRIRGGFRFGLKQNNKEELLRIVNSIRYNGGGAGGPRIGQALRYAGILFTKRYGDRPDADDIIFLFTDGRSQDRFRFQARALKERGVQFYVLAIGRRVKFARIEDVFGESNNYNIFRFSDYEDLGEFGPSRVVDRLCPYRCRDDVQ